jgi:hypothetical protein
MIEVLTKIQGDITAIKNLSNISQHITNIVEELPHLTDIMKQASILIGKMGRVLGTQPMIVLLG